MDNKIYGPEGYKEWYFSQDNNPTEGILKRIINAAKGKNIGWLETCGPTAAVNCIFAIYGELKIMCPGSYDPQPEEVLNDCLNDNRIEYRKKRSSIRKGVENIPQNRIPQFYPWAVNKVFNAKGEFMWLHNWETLIEKYLKTNKCTIQLCFKKPGHYFAVIAYDEEKNEMIYNDPWAAHRKNKNGGHLERLTKEEYETNTAGYCIVYTKE